MSAPAAIASSSWAASSTSTSIRSPCGAAARARRTASASERAGGEVVVLDQHARAEVEAVVGAAAGAHRQLLQHAARPG